MAPAARLRPRRPHENRDGSRVVLSPACVMAARSVRRSPSSSPMPTGRTGPNRCRSKSGDPAQHKAVSRPRPGHADLAGAIKYNFPDARYILERASARETTARVAVGRHGQTVPRPFRDRNPEPCDRRRLGPSRARGRVGRDRRAQPENAKFCSAAWMPRPNRK